MPYSQLRVTIVNVSHITVVHQFDITPKAFANFSPGFERSENPGIGSFRLVQP